MASKTRKATSPPVGVAVGSVSWIDLTVKDAVRLRDFYKTVVGWEARSLDMGGYTDFSMSEPKSGRTVAGICHKRGSNADLPTAWLVYLTVEDVDASARRCAESGGRVVVGPRNMGTLGRFCVIRDPAGAVAALFRPAK